MTPYHGERNLMIHWKQNIHMVRTGNKLILIYFNLSRKIKGNLIFTPFCRHTRRGVILPLGFFFFFFPAFCVQLLSVWITFSAWTCITHIIGLSHGYAQQQNGTVFKMFALAQSRCTITDPPCVTDKMVASATVLHSCQKENWFPLVTSLQHTHTWHIVML